MNPVKTTFRALLCAGALVLLACGSSSTPADGPAAPREAGAEARPTETGAHVEARTGDVGGKKDTTAQPTRWESIKSAPSVRYHTATLLKNGDVLIAGGEQELTTGSSKLAVDTWLFKAASGTFVAAGKLPSGRNGMTATLLEDGRVLLAGGEQGSWAYLAEALLFDPSKTPDQAWAAAKAMPGKRARHAAVALSGNRVALIGGTFDVTNLDSFVIYEGTTNTWTTPGLAKLKHGSYGHSATLLSTGKVVIAGGVQSGTELTWLDTIQIWDPSTGAVTTATAKLTQARAYQTAHLLPANKILLVGGICGSYGLCSLSSDQLWDATVDKVADLPHHGPPPAGHDSVSLADGRVVVTGGRDKVDETKAVVYSPADSSWRELPAMPTGRSGHTATLLADGSVLMVGGENNQTGLTLETADRLFNP